MNYIFIVNEVKDGTEDSEVRDLVRSNAKNIYDEIEVYRPTVDKGKKKRSYSLEFVKRIVHRTSIKSKENSTCIVFTEGECLTDLSQNALLKTLEDSRYSFVIFIKNISILLDTIQSRCNIIYINRKVSSKEVVKNVDHSKIEVDVLSKMQREEVITFLDRYYQNLSNEDKIIFYEYFDDAVKKIKANCKVDASLYNLLGSIEKIV